MTDSRMPAAARTGLLVAGGFGLLASVAWLAGHSYSRGYDFFLWIYNAWYLVNVGDGWALPNWSSYSAAGQPFFKMAGLSDGVVLALLTWLVGPFAAAKLFVAAFYVIAATGCRQLARSLGADELVSLVASCAFVLAWFMTITVYFQGYLSNFMIYALMPWYVLSFSEALRQRRFGLAVAAGCLLALSITGNPQVAIKLVLFGGAWALLFASWGRTVGSHLVIGGVVVLMAVWLSLFNIVSGLEGRAEVVTVSQRTNGMHAPWKLFLLPAYALSAVLNRLLEWQPFEIPLLHLRFSGYPGLSVVALAALSWPWYRSTRAAAVRGLWILTGAAYLLYWVVLGFIPASSWVGISHNLLVYPALTLGLLAGFGANQLRAWAIGWFGAAWGRWVVVVTVGAVVADLGGAALALTRYGVSRTPPQELPEARVWRRLHEGQGGGADGRLFSYNPDHSIYLYPVITGRETANVIDLRLRNPEYQSYLDFVDAHAKQGGEASPAQLLGLLNVRFVDVPAKAFTYGGSAYSDAPYERYERGLRQFAQDADLVSVLSRSEEAEDVGWRRQDTAPTAIHRRAHDPERIAQKIYRNELAAPAFTTRRVVALVGEPRLGQEWFERLAARSDFAYQETGYLLLGEDDQLTEPEQRIVESVLIDAREADSWTGAGRGARATGPRPVVVRRSQEEVDIILVEQPEDAYLFVSQQYFRSWEARAHGRGLPLHKAAAGLTAIYVPAGTGLVSLRYQLPESERWARRASLLGLLALAGVAIRGGWRHWGLSGRITGS